MDSTANTEEAVIFWEAKDGAEGGRPELPSTVNLTFTGEKAFTTLTLFPVQRSRQSSATKQVAFQRKKEKTLASL